MDDSQYSKLNDGQRQCLRLVLAHLNSKEIGRELNISPHTVDQRLRQAMKSLEASSRFEAARKFAEYEGAEAYQPLIYQSSDVEKIPEFETVGLSIERSELDGSDAVSGLSSGGGNLKVAIFEKPSIKSTRLPFPRFRGEKNTLSTWERIGWIIAIAIGSALSFGGILSGLEALSRLSG
ncbi:MAG: helix-turn-helix transcriptional regulator [Parasphingorhabdus sp.]